MENQIKIMLSKKDIRPKLDLDAVGETEGFQNKTLRPILKLQHEILLLVFKTWSEKHRINLFSLNVERFNSILEKEFSKNNVVKNQLVGIVIGQFTAEEYKEYIIKSSEYNKRIFNMIKKRLFDSFEELKKK